MRTLVTIVLALSAGAAFGQGDLFGLHSTLTTEEIAVSWRDEFVVTYSVSGLPAGEYFISAFDGRARVAGGVPWHGFIGGGKTTTVKLTVVFDSSYIRDNWGDRASLSVAASRKENP